MINRRKFLGHSALSAGSVLFSSGLLQSCTKYGIPLPGGNTPPPLHPPPPLLSLNINWYDEAKLVLTAGLKNIPYVGSILSAFVSLFWPNTTPKEDVWGEIRAQVEALINQKINDLVYQQVSDDLQGLNNSLTLYLHEVKNGTNADIETQWIVTRNLFVDALPHFQSKGYEVLLLPLFGQFANMYLALLRDGVAFGKSWGRSDADHQQDIQDLKNAIRDFTTYVPTTYTTGRTNLQRNTGTNIYFAEPFRTVNNYDRQMAFTVLDFMAFWPRFDVIQYPNGFDVELTREIYTDPFGNIDKSDSGPIVLPSAPTQGPTQLTVWGFDRIDAVQLTYPAGSGPGGVTTTPRMGDQPHGTEGGINYPPYGGQFTITPNNPLIVVRTLHAQEVVNAMQFQFYDGTITNLLGGRVSGGVYEADTGWIGYNYEYISSIYIHGTSQHYGSADIVVYGFKHWQPPAATLRAIRILYVNSPKELSAADFAQAFPALGISANLTTEEWKTARQAYWAYIEARVKEIR